MTTTDTFSAPDPVEIIPADQIRPLIAATERELELLERTAAEAIAAADDAEEWERSATNDGDASAWSLIRAHREERDEAQRDAQVMIDLATRHAQYLIDEAQAEADEILGRRTPAGSRSTEGGQSSPTGGGLGVAPVAEARVVDAPTVVPPVVAPRVAEPPSASQASTPNGAHATAVLDAPTVQVPVVIPAAAPAPSSAPSAPTTAAPPIPPAPKPPAPTVVSEPVVVAPQPAVATAQPAVANDGFWAAEGSAKRRFTLPFSAVLEATAVLLILVFILLRLS